MLARERTSVESLQLGSGGRPATATSVSADRVDRFVQWLIAVDAHEPGQDDEALIGVAGWSNEQLRGVWVDLSVFVQLMRNVRLQRFMLQTPGQRATEIRYSAVQRSRLVSLACAATGRLAGEDCLEMKAATGLDEPARPLAAHAAADRERTGEDNYLLRRAALLHSDIAMMQPQGRVESFPPSNRSLGPQSWRIDIADGRSLEAGLTAVHWDIARLAVANVKPAGANRPEPQRDPMVRAWYTATAAWMQYREDHDTLHLDRARELFPGDAALLFLSGCQRESYAAPAIQAAARSVVLPTGITAGIESERNELRHAETFFRRALALQPDHGEAHLRLGRVLALLRRPAEAAPELNQALNLLDDDDLRYYAELFSGAVAEALGRFDAARDAYRRASELFPLAQSPYLGLSELAHRRGDRAAAAAAMQKVFDLPAPVVGARDDPWWRYHVAQARNADDLVNAVRAPFHRSEQ